MWKGAARADQYRSAICVIFYIKNSNLSTYFPKKEIKIKLMKKDVDKEEVKKHKITVFLQHYPQPF